MYIVHMYCMVVLLQNRYDTIYGYACDLSRSHIFVFDESSVSSQFFQNKFWFLALLKTHLSKSISEMMDPKSRIPITILTSSIDKACL